MRFCRRLFIVSMLLVPLAVQASGLRLTPLRLDMSAASTSAQIELTNLGPQPVAVQIKAFRWTQVEGRDQYEPTKDIFFAPPIVSVPAQSGTLVRFRLRGGVPADTEAAYRVYFQEIAPAETATPTGMSFRIRFGVPLFVAPARPSAPSIALAPAVRERSLHLAFANRGRGHVKIEGVELHASDADAQRPGEPLARATHSMQGTNYLLPGSEHAWELALPEGHDPARLRMLIRTNDYSGRALPGLSNRGWVWMPLPGDVPPGTP